VVASLVAVGAVTALVLWKRGVFTSRTGGTDKPAVGTASAANEQGSAGGQHFTGDNPMANGKPGETV